jgi:RNA polymerase sigma-70 factor (ECF subfamily)
MNLADPSCDELVLRVAAGDRSALELLIGRQKALVSPIISGYVRNPADREDMAQEVRLRVWRSARTFDPARGSCRAWLAQIVRNVCKTYLHRRNRLAEWELTEADVLREDQEQSIIESAVDPSPSSLSEALDSVTNFSDVVHCIRQLPDDVQKVVILHLVEEIGFKELADVFDVSVGGVHGRYRAGLRSVQWCLRKKGYRLGCFRIRLRPTNDRFLVDLIETKLGNNSYDLVVWALDPLLRHHNVDLMFLDPPLSFTVALIHQTVEDVLYGDKRITGHAGITNSRTELVVSITVNHQKE